MPTLPYTADAPANALQKLTQGQAAELIGKPAVWLRDNAHIVGDARNADGTYNGPRLVRAFYSKDALADLNLADLKRREIEVRIRKEEAQAEKCEAELREKLGDLISHHDVEVTLSEALSTLRATLKGLPKKMASRLPENVYESAALAMREEIDRALLGVTEDLNRRVIGYVEEED